MQWIDWMLSHWETVLAAAWALLSLLNAVTEHADGASGARRLLLLALDWFSGLQSRQSQTGEGVARGLRIKAPLLQLSPPQDRIARRVAQIKEARRG